ncbi:MAG: serine hydrolase domain-containing protein [Candidatus Promineifilaceae bacterium]
MTYPKPTAAELNLMQGSPPPADKLVTTQNWQTGDPVRWSFKNVQQLIPCAHAHRGYGIPSVLPTAPAPVDIDAIPFTDHKGETWTVASMLNHTYTDAFLIMHQGQLVSERYIDMQPYQRHLLQSVSKSLTATLLAVMVGRGDINLGKTVADYLPEFASSAYGDATVQHVLDMSASIKYDETYDNLQADVTLHTIAGGWFGHVDRTGPYADVPQSLYNYLPTLTEKAEFEHGDVFRYVSANTDVLGIIMERVSGRSFIELFQEHVWQHIGAEEDIAMTLDPWGCAFPNGGFNITARDLARFGMMTLNNGNWNGKQIVPASFYTDTRQNGNNDAWRRGEAYADILPNGSYRNQFWNTGNNHGAFFCVGIHGQYCYIDPTTKTVIVKLSSHPIALVEDNSIITLLAFDAIAKALPI